MIKKSALLFFVIAIAVLGLTTSPVARAQEDEISTEETQDPVPTIDIVGAIKDEIDEGKQKAAEVATGRVKGALKSISDFFVEKVGINLIEGAKLLGQFFIWAFEALAAFVRWVLSFI